MTVDIEKRIEELCARGEFSEELLALMDQLQEGVDLSEDGYDPLHEEDEEEGSFEEQEETPIDPIQELNNQWVKSIYLGGSTNINVDQYLEQGVRQGLSVYQAKQALKDLTHQLNREDYYIKPKLALTKPLNSLNIWDWVQGDDLVISQEPLSFNHHDLSVALTTIVTDQEISCQDFLRLWGSLGCRFHIS